MEYYDKKDRKARRYALAITLLLLLLLALWLSSAVFEVHLFKREVSPVEIVFEEFAEPEEEPEKPTPEQEAPTDVRNERTTAHVEEASVEQHEQTEGAKPETQTVNTNALFKPVVGNVEELQAEGNRLASNGEQESNRGDNGGYNLIDDASQLDAGLYGRGLLEGLPKPRTTFNMAGRVVVFVTVDSEGNVVSAVVEQRGTTTSDGKLHDLAIEAAMKVKFKESEKLLQSGWITYDFKVK